MNSTTVNTSPAPRYFERVYVWQWPIRIFHWVTAFSVVALFVTGWLIAEPLLGSSGDPADHFVMGRVRQVHLIAAMAFTVAFVWRSIWFFLGNRHARSGFPCVWKPSWWVGLARQAGDYLKLEAGRPHLGHNSLAGLSYTLFVIGLGLVQIFTGFALYGQSAPGGIVDRTFGWVLPLLGGAMRTTSWHHLAAWGFVVFVILHVYIILIDARQYRNGLIVSIISGFKFREKTGGEDGRPD